MGIIVIPYEDTSFDTFRKAFAVCADRDGKPTDCFVYQTGHRDTEWFETTCAKLNAVDKHAEWSYSIEDKVLIQQRI